MKTCAKCGNGNADEVLACCNCGSETFNTDPPGAEPETAPPDLDAIAKRRNLLVPPTFRNIGVMMLRLQAIWFVYSALQVALYYLPGEIQMLLNTSTSLVNLPGLRNAVFMTILKIVFHLVIAYGFVRFSDRLLAFITSDFEVKEPPASGDKPTVNS